MPRYFFNVRNHISSEDFVGTELVDLDAAKVEALKDIADIMHARSDTVGNKWPEWSIEICDHNRELLLVMPFSQN